MGRAAETDVDLLINDETTSLHDDASQRKREQRMIGLRERGCAMLFVDYGQVSTPIVLVGRRVGLADLRDA